MPLWTDPDLWVPLYAGGVASARSSPLPPNVVRPGDTEPADLGEGHLPTPDPGPYDPDSAEAS